MNDIGDNNKPTVIDNGTEIDVNIDYDYDPKNVNDLGERVSVPNTGKKANTLLIIFGSLIIIVSIILITYYLIKRNKKQRSS